MKVVAAFAFVVFFAVVVGLAGAYRRLRRAAEIEDAEAVLRAELEDDARFRGVRR